MINEGKQAIVERIAREWINPDDFTDYLEVDQHKRQVEKMEKYLR